MGGFVVEGWECHVVSSDMVEHWGRCWVVVVGGWSVSVPVGQGSAGEYQPLGLVGQDREPNLGDVLGCGQEGEGGCHSWHPTIGG